MSDHAIQLETPQDYNTFSENNANNYFKCPSKSVRVFLAESFGMYLFILYQTCFPKNNQIQHFTPFHTSQEFKFPCS